MTKIKVTPTKVGSRIEITQLGSSKSAVASQLNDCATGSCTCSTEEFQKVDSIEVHDTGDGLEVDVRTKTGESIDPSCVQECLGESAATSAENGSCC